MTAYIYVQFYIIMIIYVQQLQPMYMFIFKHLSCLWCVKEIEHRISHSEKQISIFFQIEWNMIVVKVFFSILNQMELNLV